MKMSRIIAKVVFFYKITDPIRFGFQARIIVLLIFTTECHNRLATVSKQHFH